MKRLLLLTISSLCISVFGPVLAAQSEHVSPERVDAAMKKAIAYIYSRQKGDHWELVNRPDGKSDHADVRNWQWGGVTAVACCALLYAGETPQKPELARAIKWLENADMVGIYAVGFRCQVWGLIRAPNRKVLMRDRDYLLAAVHKSGEGGGFYPYYLNPADGAPKPDGWYDHSVSQYGVLGMWSLAQQAIEVPTNYWTGVELAWKSHQTPAGGWGYRLRDNNKDWVTENVGMTAAGLATLYITQEMAHSMDGLNCTGNYRDESIERAVKWLSANFSTFRNRHPYYALYGVERVGVAGGFKYFGNLNWYQVGAKYLLETQQPDGSWGKDDAHWNPNKVPDTCFGLMFLARGRAPVMMNKLEYVVDQAGDKPKPASWNERCRDVANITRWVGHNMERFLNWQIVNLNAPVEELHDANILWISGRDVLNFSQRDADKLKLFVEQGGLILGHADCGNKSFADGFRKLGSKLFPAYEFRELPTEHIIYTGQQFRRPQWPKPPFIEGLSNGVRELMLLFPTADPGRAWQTMSFSGPREPLAQVMANIFQYSVDKSNLRYRGQTYIVTPSPSVKTERTIRVARLQYAGNWDPEPGGWRRLAAIMRNDHKTELVVETVAAGSGKLNPRTYPVAHLTGTSRFKLPEDARQELKRYVESGGTLVIDAAGGSSDFAMAAEAEMLALFPSAKGYAILKPDHPVYSAGVKTTRFAYRQYARRMLGNLPTPRIRGHEIDGKVRLFTSAEDLSAGLVGQSVDGIYGYDPETATAIMTNIIFYATHAAPTTAPATRPASAPPAKTDAKPAPRPAGKKMTGKQ